MKQKLSKKGDKKAKKSEKSEKKGKNRLEFRFTSKRKLLPDAIHRDDAASFSRHSPRLGGDGPAADSAAAPLPAAGISGSRRSGGELCR